MSLRTLIIISLGLGFLLLLFTVGFPFLLALVLAIFLEPLNQLMIQYFRMKRVPAVVITNTLFTIGLLGSLYLIGLNIFTQILAYMDRADVYAAEIQLMLQDIVAKTEIFYDSLSPEAAEKFDQGLESGITALAELIKGLSGKIISIAKTVPNLFIVYIVFSVALYLFSFALPTMKKDFLSIFEKNSRSKVERVLADLKASIFGFLRAQLILSSLTYLIALLALILLDVQYAMAIAFLIVLVDLLPILGTGSFIMPWAVYEAVKGELFLSIGLTVLFIFITVFRRIIEPKVLGDSVGIGALSALISLYIGFKLVGVIGLFLGPIVVIIYQAMRKVGLLNINIKFDEGKEEK